MKSTPDKKPDYEKVVLMIIAFLFAALIVWVLSGAISTVDFNWIISHNGEHHESIKGRNNQLYGLRR